MPQGSRPAAEGRPAYFRSQLGDRLDPLPALDLVLIVAGLPVVAACGGWLLAGREPSAIASQPAE